MPKSISVATIILAGGQGTRLHPLTIHHSKPAVSYGGRYKLIDIPISNSINSDFRQIFVIAQYLSGELEQHINQSYHFDASHPGSIDILTPQKNEKEEISWFSGTADAVRKNLPALLKSTADYFLILSGDQLYNINFQRMLGYAQEKQAELTIASIPIQEKEAQRMGLLKIDPDGNVLDFVEKPKDPSILERFRLSSDFFKTWQIEPRQESYYLGSMGIYVFRRDALISLLQTDNREDFGYHLISTSVQNGQTSAFIYHGYWEDIGTVASYYDANLMLTEAAKGLNAYDEKNPIYTKPTFLPGPRIKSTKIQDSVICEGSIIEAKEISHCIIGLRSHIKKGTILRDTVMMGNHCYTASEKKDQTLSEDFAIGENCLIKRAIIDEQVKIGNKVKLVNKEKLNQYDGGQGIFIRDGIIIVTSGTCIPDHFEL